MDVFWLCTRPGPVGGNMLELPLAPGVGRLPTLYARLIVDIP